jgi:chromosome segregation ATPase
MRRQAIDNLRAAIEANTEKRSIEQLQAQGKRHVRVVSGEKVMQIIKAIVADIVDREVGEVTQQDRERIVNETKQQFDRVLKMQSEQDDLIKEQKEIVADYRRKVEQMQGDYERARREADELRSGQAGREAKLLADSQEKMQKLVGEARAVADKARDLEFENKRLADEKARAERTLEDERAQRRESEERVKRDHEARIEKLHAEQRDLAARFESERGDLAGRQEHAVTEARQRVSELEARLAETSEARIVLEQRAERTEADAAQLRGQAEEATEHRRKAERIVAKQEARLEKAKAILESAQTQIHRLQEERQRLETELAAARERAGESDAVGQLRGELEGVKSFLQQLGEKSSGANEATVDVLLSKLSERETLNSSSLEDRFNASLDASLDKITKAMELATAKPIDMVVEATDVLVDKIFDMPDSVMSSNLDELEVEQRTTKGNIAGSLQALKAMRAGAAKPKEKDKADAGKGKDEK